MSSTMPTIATATALEPETAATAPFGLAPSLGMRTLRSIRSTPEAEPRPEWSLDTVAGRLVELSNNGTTPAITAASYLLREAQEQGEPAAWLTLGQATFFPPDLYEGGVDLDALPVVRVPDSQAAARAADKLLRSGGFALVVLDFDRLSGQHARLPIAQQTRLVGLCHKHRSTLLCLTQKTRDSASLGSLVGLRADGSTQRTGFRQFTWTLHFLKDKRQGPGWSHVEVCRGPTGLS